MPVISSSEHTVRARVGSAPALVVATPGAEPVAEGGYAAALLLDGNQMLARPWLRAEEQTLRRWFNAAALVRSAEHGGTVVVTADQDRAVSALVRWDPAGHSERELHERHELGLPPRCAPRRSRGPRGALAATLRDLQLPERVRVVVPAPVENTPGNGADVAENETGETSDGTLDGLARAGSAETARPGRAGAGSGEDRPYRALLFFGFGYRAQDHRGVARGEGPGLGPAGARARERALRRRRPALNHPASPAVRGGGFRVAVPENGNLPPDAVPRAPEVPRVSPRAISPGAFSRAGAARVRGPAGPARSPPTCARGSVPAPPGRAAGRDPGP